jgi:hypothetical protein
VDGLIPYTPVEGQPPPTFLRPTCSWAVKEALRHAIHIRSPATFRQPVLVHDGERELAYAYSSKQGIDPKPDLHEAIAVARGYLRPGRFLVIRWEAQWASMSTWSVSEDLRRIVFARLNA